MADETKRVLGLVVLAAVAWSGCGNSSGAMPTAAGSGATGGTRSQAGSGAAGTGSPSAGGPSAPVNTASGTGGTTAPSPTPANGGAGGKAGVGSQSGAGGSNATGGGGGAGGVGGVGGTSADTTDAGTDPTKPGDDDCVVAAKLDTCCGNAVLATVGEVAAHECLVLWTERRADPALSQACFAQSPMDCAVVSCAIPVAPSHNAARDENGQCTYVDECESADDCVPAADRRWCCDCGQPMPREVAEADPCLWINDEPVPVDADKCEGNACLNVLCGACAPPDPVTCEAAPGSGLRSCR